MINTGNTRKVLVDVNHLHSHANGRKKKRQTFSFIDFRDVVSELLAVNAERKMIISTFGLLQDFTFQVNFTYNRQEAEVIDFHQNLGIV